MQFENMKSNFNVLPVDTYICKKSLKKLFGIINIKFKIVLGEERGIHLSRLHRAQIPNSAQDLVADELYTTLRQVA